MIKFISIQVDSLEQWSWHIWETYDKGHNTWMCKNHLESISTVFKRCFNRQSLTLALINHIFLDVNQFELIWLLPPVLTKNRWWAKLENSDGYDKLLPLEHCEIYSPQKTLALIKIVFINNVYRYWNIYFIVSFFFITQLS